MNDAHVIFTYDNGRRFVVGPPHAALDSDGELTIDLEHLPGEIQTALLTEEPLHTEIWSSPPTIDAAPYEPNTKTAT